MKKSTPMPAEIAAPEPAREPLRKSMLIRSGGSTTLEPDAETETTTPEQREVNDHAGKS